MSYCTSLDHVYPATVPGTPCYCGRNTWAGAARLSPVTVQARVHVRFVKNGEPVEATRTIIERLRDDGVVVYRVDSHVHGRSLFERHELEVA